MIITKTFKLTFDEPNNHWLCADNLKIALEKVMSNTKFDVMEIDQEPLYGCSTPTMPEVKR